MDGAEFVKGRSGDIDVIIVDSTDIIGFAKSLFTVEFFKSRQGLSDTRGDVRHPLGIPPFPQGHRCRGPGGDETHLPIVDLYTASLATYAGNWWTFSAASKKHDLRQMRRPFTSTPDITATRSISRRSCRRRCTKSYSEELDW